MQDDNNADDSKDKLHSIKIGDVTLQSSDDSDVSSEDQQTKSKESDSDEGPLTDLSGRARSPQATASIQYHQPLTDLSGRASLYRTEGRKPINVSSEDQQTKNKESDSDGAPLKSSGNGINSGKQGQGYYIIGVITIIFGIIVGIYLIVTITDIVGSSGELTFRVFAIALGVSMLFIVPGVLCIGIAQIIKLLDK